MILREEDESGRAMVMRDDERMSAARSLNRNQAEVMEISRLSGGESLQLVCERENPIFDAFVDF